MHVALVVKSDVGGMKLGIYNEDLSLIESETFQDLYTLNFHLQTLAKKHEISRGLLVTHDMDKNKVDLSLAKDEHSFFVS